MEWMKLKVGKCLSPDPAGNQKTCPCDFLKIYRFITATKFALLYFEDRRMLLTEAVCKK